MEISPPSHQQGVPAWPNTRHTEERDRVQTVTEKPEVLGRERPDRHHASSASQPSWQEGGYGWVVVLGVWLMNAHTWGLNSSYAVFLAYYLRSDYFEGAGPVSFAFVGGLSISIALALSPLATMTVRVIGTQLTLLLGVIFETAAFVGASFTGRIWHLILSQGVAFGIGMGFCFIASVGVVPQWFIKRRSFANAVASSGSGFGGLCYSLASNAMIRSIGLPWAFRVLAIVAFVVNGTCIFLIRDRNKALGAIHVAFHKELFSRLDYFFFLAWAFFSLLGYIILVFSLPDYCQSVGMTAVQGSLVGAIFNLAQGVGRPIIGLISDSAGRLNVAGLGTLFCGVCCLLIWTLAGHSFTGSIVFSLVGIVAGILWATAAPVCAEIVGIELLPSALSVLWVALVLPATFSEVIGLELRHGGHNGYLPVQLLAGLMYTTAFVFLWALRSRKIVNEEETNERTMLPTDETICGDLAHQDGPSEAQDGPLAQARRPSLGAYVRMAWAMKRI